MPEQNQTQSNQPLAKQPSAPAETPQPSESIAARVIDKINSSHNILIALSSDPSVDEMASAIGLSLHLDRLSKRATAIYSGRTPNALEFLNPDETFEKSTDALQDFVIALSKEKADHLRYKLDGDYVKIFITPYRARISEEDLDFSYGDYNVDLVISLGVENGIDLDDALREHGRIMHDASIINITTGNPGKFGEIEWSDKNASSVSEMIANLLYHMDGDIKIDADEATAFLTGIVAATDRFSRANTTSECMELASRLMDSGAKHQLISKNITEDIDNKFYSSAKSEPSAAVPPAKTEEAPSEPAPSTNTEPSSEEERPKDIPLENSEPTPAPAEDSSLLEELRNAEANLANTGAETTPEATNEPLRLDEPAPSAMPEAPKPLGFVSDIESPASSEASESSPLPSPTLPPVEPTAPAEPAPMEPTPIADTTGKTINPSSDFSVDTLAEGSNKYGKMLEDALNETREGETKMPEPQNTNMAFSNPAANTAPAVASAPEINGVPEINYMPLPGDEVLPPPPAPPINFEAPMPTSAPATAPASAPEPMPTPSVDAPVVTPSPAPNSMPEQTMPMPNTPPAPVQSQPATSSPAEPSAPAPDAFKIPGM